MCELLGMSANVPTDICFSFTGLVQRGGGTGPHKDGWGITFYEGKGCRTFKDPQPSFQSPIAKLVQEYPIKSCSVIAHIRQAQPRYRCAGKHSPLYPGTMGAQLDLRP
ncbi:glutamine amidotransferase [Klebsiella michiganensis]|uniref:Glutamine amidotransferase n=1 Tax=Klebsiella michiganensis TaxID=1134687 RepID=A0A7H4N6Y8_9ENTR|nr:glutamine amidotransferase [Klebsiella michiganensis]